MAISRDKATVYRAESSGTNPYSHGISKEVTKEGKNCKDNST